MKRNISDFERAVSIVAAAGLLLRGISGFCPASAAIGRNTRRTNTKDALGGPRGVHVRDSITIHRPVEAVYAFWRELSNLPRFMTHLENVEVIDRTRSRWTVRGPAGTSVSWEAHIINEIPYELIAWASVDNADVISAGSVHFKPTPSGGTRIVVHLQYAPPAGKLGVWVASLFGEEPNQQIAEDLERLKMSLEEEGVGAGSSVASFPTRYPSPDGNVRPY